MGGGQSVAIPGGGTEGYHVLRVSQMCQDTSDPGHFGPKTFRHYQTGAELSRPR